MFPYIVEKYRSQPSSQVVIKQAGLRESCADEICSHCLKQDNIRSCKMACFDKQEEKINQCCLDRCPANNKVCLETCTQRLF